MEQPKGFMQVQRYFSERLRQALEKIPDKDRVQEIRLRSGRPLSITHPGKTYFVSDNGGLSANPAAGLLMDRSDIEAVFKAVCEYSVHSFQRELAQGFITVFGGHRVGICGSAVLHGNEIDTLKYIAGLNFRIARQLFGCADEIMKRIGTEPQSILLAGAPSSGKTTVLRDLCRQLGTAHRLSIVDERGEIAAVYQGVPQNDVGCCTDVLDGYPKESGILTAIRVLSPEIAAVDEIGGTEDCTALEHSMHAGVKIIATAHAGSIQEIYERKHIRTLLEQNVFSKIFLLGIGNDVGKVVDVCDIRKVERKDEK